jgi:hypothetical protein
LGEKRRLDGWGTNPVWLKVSFMEAKDSLGIPKQLRYIVKHVGDLCWNWPVRTRDEKEKVEHAGTNLQPQ